MTKILMYSVIVGLLFLILSLSIVIVWYSSIYSSSLYSNETPHVSNNEKNNNIQQQQSTFYSITTNGQNENTGGTNNNTNSYPNYNAQQEREQHEQAETTRQTRTLSSRKIHRRDIYNKYANTNTNSYTNEPEHGEDYKYDISTRIVGGTRTKEGKYPFYVFPAGGLFLCGGTLIYDDIVLSAAHCYEAFADTEGVFIGGTMVDGTHSDYILVDTIYPHPNYIPGYEYNDIMIIKLASASTVTPIPLNYNFNVDEDDTTDTSTKKTTAIQERDEEIVNYDEFNDGGGKSASIVSASASVSSSATTSVSSSSSSEQQQQQPAIIIGFGRTMEDAVDCSLYLLAANVSIVGYESCVEFYGSNLYNTTVICAIGTVPIQVNTTKATTNATSSTITGKTRGNTGTFKEVVADACQGDSGGPLLMISPTTTSTRRRTVSSNYGQTTRNSTSTTKTTSSTELEQIGIVSFGSGCGHVGQPAVYTKIGAYKYWIQNKICQLSDNPPSHCSKLTTEPLQKASVNENDVNSVQLANFILQFTPTASSNNNHRPVAAPVCPSPSEDDVNQSSAANTPAQLSSPIPPSIEQLLQAVITIPSHTFPTTTTTQETRSTSLGQPSVPTPVPSDSVPTNNDITQVRAVNRNSVPTKDKKKQTRRRRKKQKQVAQVPVTTRANEKRLETRRKKRRKKKDTSKGDVSVSAAVTTSTMLSKKQSNSPSTITVSATTNTPSPSVPSKRKQSKTSTLSVSDVKTTALLSKKQSKTSTSVQQDSSSSNNATQFQKRRYYQFRDHGTKKANQN